MASWCAIEPNRPSLGTDSESVSFRIGIISGPPRAGQSDGIGRIP
jgi:hypothetical protein